MNQPASLTSLPDVNRAFVTPRSNLGQFVSDAEFRADHYFCNRLNVAALGATPKGEHQIGQSHVFIVETDPRPFNKPRLQDTCFATFAAPSNTEELNDLVACTVVTDSERPAEQASRATLSDGEPRVAGLTMAELEGLAITQTLQRCSGNRTRAARMLGVSVRTLQRKLNSWSSKCHES
jgi:DNA-binding protein Fis